MLDRWRILIWSEGYGLTSIFPVVLTSVFSSRIYLVMWAPRCHVVSFHGFCIQRVDPSLAFVCNRVFKIQIICFNLKGWKTGQCHIIDKIRHWRRSGNYLRQAQFLCDLCTELHIHWYCAYIYPNNSYLSYHFQWQHFLSRNISEFNHFVLIYRAEINFMGLIHSMSTRSLFFRRWCVRIKRGVGGCCMCVRGGRGRGLMKVSFHR